MHPFTLSRPTDVSAAIAAHAQNAKLAFIAGGTDLIGLMKDRVTLPDHLLDINRLAGMSQIEALSDGGLRIGALARMSDVAANPDVRSRFPVIAESLLFLSLIHIFHNSWHGWYSSRSLSALPSGTPPERWSFLASVARLSGTLVTGNRVYLFGSFLEILKSWGGTMKSTMSPMAATSTKRRKSNATL